MIARRKYLQFIECIEAFVADTDGDWEEHKEALETAIRQEGGNAKYAFVEFLNWFDRKPELRTKGGPSVVKSNSSPVAIPESDDDGTNSDDVQGDQD